MKIRGRIFRLLRLIAVAVLAWLTFQALEPRGLGWTVLLAAFVITLVAAFLGWKKRRKHTRRIELEDAWTEALVRPGRRKETFAALRNELSRMKGSNRRERQEKVRLTLMLAELLQADDQPEAVINLCRELQQSAINARARSMLAHAIATAHLSANEPQKARSVINRAEPQTDAELSLRMRVLSALIENELGNGEDALKELEMLRTETRDDLELGIECKVARATVIDTLGDRNDAVQLMKSLGTEVLGMLEILGLPKTRKLASVALDALTDSEPTPN